MLEPTNYETDYSFAKFLQQGNDLNYRNIFAVEIKCVLCHPKSRCFALSLHDCIVPMVTIFYG